MSGEVDSKEFYNNCDWIEKKLLEQAKLGLGKNANIRLEYDNPKIIDNNVAANWLLMNYTFTTDFMEGRMPGVAEMSASITSQDNGNSTIIMGTENFHSIGKVFEEFRKVEHEYKTEFLEQFKKYQELHKGRGFSFKIGQKVTDFINLFDEIYKIQGQGIHKMPQIYGDVWLIGSPSRALIYYWKADDGKFISNSIHTHPATKNWRGAVMSSHDFEALEKTYEYSPEDPIEKHDEYVMNIPGGSLLRNVENVCYKAGRDDASKLVAIADNADMFDEMVERGIIGIDHAWYPKEELIKVSPVITEVHYNSGRAHLPEGIPLGVSGCYLESSEGKIELNFLEY